jgi:hypothetical protein
MKHRTRTLTDRVKSFTAHETSTIEVPLDRWINQFDLRVDLTQYDTGSSVSLDEDGILELVDKVEVVVNGDSIRTWDPARYWYGTPIDYGVEPELTDPKTSTGQTDISQGAFHLPILQRLNPADPYDLSAAIPAHEVSSLDVKVHWGSASDLGTGYTIDSADVSLSVSEFNLTPQEEQQVFGASGAAVTDSKQSRLKAIHESEKIKTFSASNSNYQFTVDLPVGAVLLHSDLFVVDNGSRDDDLVDKFRIRQHSPDERTYDRVRWEESQMQDVRDHRLDDPIEGNRYLTGHTRLDFTRYALRGQGNPFNLVGRSKGDVTIGIENNSPTSTSEAQLLNRQVRPVSY